MRVVLTGGGSGGHIYPALAIARGLLAEDPDTELLYVGTDHGLERDLVPRAHVPFAAVHARGLLVPGLRGKMAGVLSALRGTAEAWGILRRFRPDVVVGTGGYVSGPVGLAAGFLNIPLSFRSKMRGRGLRIANWPSGRRRCWCRSKKRAGTFLSGRGWCWPETPSMRRRRTGPRRRPGRRWASAGMSGF